MNRARPKSVSLIRGAEAGREEREMGPEPGVANGSVVSIMSVRASELRKGDHCIQSNQSVSQSVNPIIIKNQATHSQV